MQRGGIRCAYAHDCLFLFVFICRTLNRYLGGAYITMHLCRVSYQLKWFTHPDTSSSKMHDIIIVTWDSSQYSHARSAYWCIMSVVACKTLCNYTQSLTPILVKVISTIIYKRALQFASLFSTKILVAFREQGLRSHWRCVGVAW